MLPIFYLKCFYQSEENASIDCIITVMSINYEQTKCLERKC